MNIAHVTTTSSKEEEIQTLEKIARIAEPGSYLSSLFSEGLIKWVKAQIRDDGNPDLFAFYQQTEADETKQYARAEALRVDMAGMEKAHAQDMAAALQNGQVLTIANGELESKLRKSIDLLEDARGETYNTQQRLCAALRAIDEQNAEICKLKAALYDIEHADR